MVQLSLFELADSDTVLLSNQYFQKNTQPVVNIYSPGSRDAKYYRFSYRAGTKMKHIHIPGANINYDLVSYRAKKIQSLIDQGVSINKIINLIDSYRGKKNYKI